MTRHEHNRYSVVRRLSAYLEDTAEVVDSNLGDPPSSQPFDGVENNTTRSC